MRKLKFLFDVDGTLTPSRQPMDELFKSQFINFIGNPDVDVYLVSGSDYQKTLEQLGEHICNNVDGVFSCSGNEIWVHGELISKNEWDMSNEQKMFLLQELNLSRFPLNYGNNLEKRTGSYNFSIVGRNADTEGRQRYIEWDWRTNERAMIADRFNTKFGSTAVATIGGETGLDITPVGKDKSQVIEHFDNSLHEIIFFGDAMSEGGNDKPLADVNTHGRNIFVSDWQYTKNYLKRYF